MKRFTLFVCTLIAIAQSIASSSSQATHNFLMHILKNETAPEDLETVQRDSQKPLSEEAKQAHKEQMLTYLRLWHENPASPFFLNGANAKKFLSDRLGRKEAAAVPSMTDKAAIARYQQEVQKDPWTFINTYEKQANKLCEQLSPNTSPYLRSYTEVSSDIETAKKAQEDRIKIANYHGLRNIRKSDKKVRFTALSDTDTVLPTAVFIYPAAPFTESPDDSVATPLMSEQLVALDVENSRHLDLQPNEGIIITGEKGVVFSKENSQTDGAIVKGMKLAHYKHWGNKLENETIVFKEKPETITVSFQQKEEYAVPQIIKKSDGTIKTIEKTFVFPYNHYYCSASDQQAPLNFVQVQPKFGEQPTQSILKPPFEVPITRAPIQQLREDQAPEQTMISGKAIGLSALALLTITAGMAGIAQRVVKQKKKAAVASNQTVFDAAETQAVV
jgi:hypothetical protein